MTDNDELSAKDSIDEQRERFEVLRLANLRERALFAEFTDKLIELIAESKRQIHGRRRSTIESLAHARVVEWLEPIVKAATGYTYDDH